MFLQFGQIVEGIGATSLAGIDETHKQVADMSAILGFIEKRAFAMQDGLFQSSFADGIVERRSRHVEKLDKFCPVYRARNQRRAFER
jgi:hypothetical protein